MTAPTFKSVRWALGFLNRLRKQKRRVEGVSQSHGCGNVALQMANNSGAIYDGISIGNVASNDECYADYSVQEGKTGSPVEIDDIHGDRREGNLLISHFQYAELRNGTVHPSNFLRSHNSITLFVDSTGQAYDLSGAKWSRS